LLDVSRIISGTFALDLGDLDLGMLVDAAVEIVQPSAEAKSIRLELKKAATVRMVGDSARLQQAIWNLLANAVKFTPQGGVIQIQLTENADWATVSVSDNGVGIASEFLPYVFDRFRQADGSTTRSFAGLGLGLAIARHIVELHGGIIRAASDGVGKGSSFSIQLPVREVGVSSSRSA
jgi:signal transduction histidine kinase